MLYGTKMIYRYKEEVPKVDSNGETIIENGDFVTEVKEKKLELCFSANTFIIYKNYTTRELMKDFFNAGTTAQKEWLINKEVLDKVKEKEEIKLDDLSEEDIEKLSKIGFNDSIEFFINITAAMIATNEYPIKRDFAEIINELPLFLFNDDKFTTELMQLVSFGLKKNSNLFQSAVAKK